MQIPRSYVENYSKALNVVSDKARAVLVDALSQIDYSADVADVRNAVISIMQPACGASSTMAARLAADFYDGLRARFGIDDGFSAEVDSQRVPEATEGAVRAFAQDLVDGKPVEQFVSKCVDRIDYETRLAANKCIEFNAKNDPKKPRWARIPTGAETCQFCIMLASRGFVYHSEETASHAHAHCDCRVVPSWDKSPLAQGYDPDKYYDMWKNPEKYQNQKQGIDQSSALSGANPNYSTGLPEWRKNCQRCVPTYEMRMRGNDVTSLPRMLDANGNSDPNDPAAIHWREIFDGAIWERCNGTGKARIETLMASWGDGARAEVYVAWKGRNSGVHVFVAENRNGTVHYLDPQSGNADVSHYFKRVKIGSTQVARIDNLQPSQWMTHCCKGVQP